MNLSNVLKQFGLNEKENKLFLVCLELGSASVYKIGKKAGLPRSTGYEVLDTLKEKGLVTSLYKKKVKYYCAVDPKKILEKTKEKIETFEKCLPAFNALYNSSKNLPSVRFYQGVEDMKIIFEEILDEAKEVSSFSSADDLFTTMGEYWPKYVTGRVKKKIPVRAIARDTVKARERKRIGPSELREVRLMPASYEHKGMTMIWGNKIALFSFNKELMALVIESEEMNRMQKAQFNFIWDTLDDKRKF